MMEFDLDINWRDIRDQKIWLFNATDHTSSPWEQRQVDQLLDLLSEIQRQALVAGHVENDVYGF
jgi:hypothetical protein